MTDKTDSSNDDKIGAALNRQRFQMLEDIARELAGDVVFPVAFSATLRVRQELQKPDLPIARVASIVSADPLVAAKLINLANSVFYRREGQAVRGLAAAIQRLGLEVVRTTALAIAMAQLLRSKEMAAFSDLAHALWTHSVKSAVAARIVASAHTRFGADEALLAGLVHDLGAFYMLYRAAQYPELRARPDTLKYVILQWHESIGASLLNALGLPEEIVEAAIDHDQPRSELPTAPRTLADVVYAANLLAGSAFEWLGKERESGADDQSALEEAFVDLLPAIEAETKDMLAVFA
jgi:HD-like signal output (HDOD) protein